MNSGTYMRRTLVREGLATAVGWSMVAVGGHVAIPVGGEAGVNCVVPEARAPAQTESRCPLSVGREQECRRDK